MSLAARTRQIQGIDLILVFYLFSKSAPVPCLAPESTQHEIDGPRSFCCGLRPLWGLFPLWRLVHCRLTLRSVFARERN